MEALLWAWDHVNELFAIATAIIAAASLVAALTPAKGDDEFWAKLTKVVDTLALNVKHATPARSVKPTPEAESVSKPQESAQP